MIMNALFWKLSHSLLPFKSGLGPEYLVLVVLEYLISVLVLVLKYSYSHIFTVLVLVLVLSEVLILVLRFRVLAPTLIQMSHRLIPKWINYRAQHNSLSYGPGQVKQPAGQVDLIKVSFYILYKQIEKKHNSGSWANESFWICWTLNSLIDQIF